MTDSAGPPATILVAEDCEDVREVLCEVFRQDGYRVLDAPSAERAIEIAAAERGPIDLLVTDLVMQGMNGGDLAARLRARLPGLAVILISGYAGESLERRGIDVAGALFLSKPVHPDRLNEAVRAALGRPSRPGRFPGVEEGPLK